MLNRVLLFFLMLFALASCYAQSGVYVTGEIGWANQPGLPSQNRVGALNVSEQVFPSAYRGGIGYIHDFVPLFGLGFDVATGKYGKTTYQFINGQVHVTSTTFEYLIDFIFHLYKYDILLKAGGIRHSMCFSGNKNFATDTRIHPELMLTLFYNFTNHFALSLGYGRMFGQKINSLSGSKWATSSLNELLAGFRITF